MVEPIERLRVAYYFAYPDSMAGASRSLFELLVHLPFTVKPIVVVTAPGKVSQHCENLGIECHVLVPGAGLMVFGKKALVWSSARRLKTALWEALPYTVQLVQFLRKRRIGLVHANDPRGALLVGPAARWARLPMVSHLRGRKAYGGLYWRAFETLSHRIITVCDATAEDVSSTHRHKTVTVYNGTRDLLAESPVNSAPAVRLAWLDQVRAKGGLVVACFASVTPFKGYHHWLQAIAQLNERIKQPVVYLGIGAVPQAAESYESWLRCQVQHWGINNFTFAGFQENPFEFYRRADITVLPSVASEILNMGEVNVDVQGNEGFPRTHLEAASMGIPVVGTRIGGVSELVEDEVTGLLVPAGDPNSLADALQRLLENRTQRKLMGQAARQRVLAQFSVEHCVQRTLGVYASLLPGLQLE